MTDLIERLYEPHIAGVRAALASDPGIQAIVDPGIEPRLLERFLIQYTSLGVYMTEPVEGWIRRAGERCKTLGLEEVGQRLVSHAHHEAGHHELMVNDTHHLVARWNAKYREMLDAKVMLAQEASPAVKAYVKLHEDTIASEMPEGQVAIELEIEQLSLSVGAPFVANCRRVLGDDILKAMSFVTDHVELDEGHTVLNRRMLEKLLTLRPERAEALARTGAEALGIYRDFLASCLDAAREALYPVKTALAS